ncbi:MAG: hypothetical protein DWI18_00930 [Planctomycetota bacterium]|nr:MAG: hypothetical protein DWI18_00930 [Planctomycetota bacterium]
MHRPGSNSDQMEPEDFLCDFCGRSWTVAQPFVEGHQGSCLCGECLNKALHAFASNKVEPTCSDLCTMCLEARKEPAWCAPAPAHSPAGRSVARVCRPCSTQATRTLERDPESGWKRPVANT